MTCCFINCFKWDFFICDFYCLQFIFVKAKPTARVCHRFFYPHNVVWALSTWHCTLVIYLHDTCDRTPSYTSDCHVINSMIDLLPNDFHAKEKRRKTTQSQTKGIIHVKWGRQCGSISLNHSECDSCGSFVRMKFSNHLAKETEINQAFFSHYQNHGIPNFSLVWLGAISWSRPPMFLSCLVLSSATTVSMS